MTTRKIAAITSLLLLIISAQAAPYSNMAPRDLYLIADRAQEIGLARSAAPPSISDNAGIMILGAHGFETAVKGTNAFTCLVERAWDKAFDDPEFWNPKMRAPICMNEAAARSVLPVYIERAQWALAGLSRDEMRARSATSTTAATPPAPGAMSYMMSKQQYLSDDGGHWHPHVMFFTPYTDPAAWGANLKASPVLGDSSFGQFTLFFIPVRTWSDGTLAEYDMPMNASGQHHH